MKLFSHLQYTTDTPEASQMCPNPLSHWCCQKYKILAFMVASTEKKAEYFIQIRLNPSNEEINVWIN